MIKNRQSSQVRVFSGTPWEVAHVKSLLNQAYIQAFTKEDGLNGIQITVPYEDYSAAIRIINEKTA
ncbi:hypothetical protein IX307_002074 [Bacteroides pyogenes]|uniref:DUF2007 domain-containing protein n=3 Tax=Bacteroides pyogenes TaxID=310300 RepID=A0A5D3F161_9BACE|nr:DUF2007-related protein [Bacteroides pyogenes]GAE16320.1 hypothetical protein JCM6292_2729 [Bacteroides pyogenes JCM 6292]MBR8704453.1 hypothetical protein [Bacteroides pyogenes]MBR8708427.1 hypothetical protein [Bacteroides pyogenes]MBR8717023.1 hypothetical protein [Bacteroides pyogenes]MBR8720898.1 hypothetical protein [Bacteroides pyogenes]